MLKLKHLFENFELAKECLSLYEHDDASLEEMLQYFRISSNAIYPFRAKDGTVCFLRLAPEEEKPLSDVESEIRLIQWLRDMGYNAMKPHAMRDGSLCRRFETRWGVYQISCFERVAGETLEDCEGSLALCRGYGKALGRLHALMTQYPYAAERRDHTSLLDEAETRLAAAPKMLSDALKDVRRALGALPIDRESYGVTHYDFEADNVLYDEETDTFGVIDFDDAIRCWYALDIVRAIDCLSDVTGDDPAAAEAALLAGYREEKALTGAQIASFPLMRRVVALQSYATIMHVLSEDVEVEPDWLRVIREKLTNTMREIEGGIGIKGATV